MDRWKANRKGEVHELESTPKWIPLLCGGVMLLMGLIILGALIGIVPVAQGGRFLAPPLVIVSLGMSLVFGGLLLWIPSQTPALLRTLLFLTALALIAVVCNWSAFAPNVVYESSTSIGPLEISGESDTGARIVFGVVALLVNVTFIFTLLASVRDAFRGFSEHD